MENIWPILIPIIVIIFLLRAAKLAPENSHFAVIKLGKFAGFIGSGFHLKFSGNETEWIKITIGDRAKVTANNLAKFEEAQLPIESKEKIEIGTFVRIIGFADEAIEIIRDQDQTASCICEKCGHENTIK